MKNQAFQDFMTQKGFKLVGLAACGVEAGYPVTVTVQNARLWEIAFAVDTDNWKNYQKDIRAEFKGLATVTCTDGIALQLAVKKNNFEEPYRAAVQKAVEFFKKSGIEPIQTCALCKKDNCDTLLLHGTRFTPVHGSCCDQLTESVREEAEKNELSGNYFLGFLGGLVGAIVGCIPSVLTIVFAEKIYALLFALIPLCIYYGYKLCKGKLNRVALVITIVLSIVSAYLIEIILLLISCITEYGIGIAAAMQVTLALLMEGETWGLMTTDSISSFVFIALGIWISWGAISKTAKSAVQSVETRMSTRTAYTPSHSSSTRENNT